MKTYTVILLYPPEVANDYGLDTYATSVNANNPSEAIKLARIECAAPDDDDEDTLLDDYACLFCCEGGHNDLTPPEYRGY